MKIGWDLALGCGILPGPRMLRRLPVSCNGGHEAESKAGQNRDLVLPIRARSVSAPLSAIPHTGEGASRATLV